MRLVRVRKLASQDVRRVRGQPPASDRLADLLHEQRHEGQVVQRDEARGRELVRAR